MKLKPRPPEYRLPLRPITGTQYQARTRNYDFPMNASQAARFLGVDRNTLGRWIIGKHLQISCYREPPPIPPYEMKRVPRKNGKGKRTVFTFYRYQLMEWVDKYRVHTRVKKRRADIRRYSISQSTKHYHTDGRCISAY